MQNFDMSKINIISNNLSAINMSEITLLIIDSFAQELKDLFIDPAKTTGMYKEVPVNNKKRKKPNTNRPWFNYASNTLKNNYKSFKKTLRGKSEDTNNDELISLVK